MQQRNSSINNFKSLKALWKEVVMKISEDTLRKIILFCLGGLLLILPVAHTTSLRAFFFLFAVLIWLIRIGTTKEWKIFGTPLDIPLFLYLIIILISFFTSLNLKYSIHEFRGEFLTYTLLFYLTLNNLKREEEIKRLVFTLLAGSFFMSLYGMYDFFYVNKSNILNIDKYRFGSLHQGYEAYAQYLLMVLPLNIMAIIYLKDFRRRFLFTALLLLNTFALFLTHTRGAWIAFWAELLLVSIFAIKRTAIKIFLISGLVIITLLMIKILPTNVILHGEKATILTSDADITKGLGKARLIMWKASLEEILKNPFKGSGYGKTTFRWKFKDRIFAGSEQSHNTFVNTAIQLGIQGLIALLFIIYVILIFQWRCFKKAKTNFQLLYFLSIMIMTIGFFIGNMFAEFYIDDTVQMFWLLIGLSVALHRIQKKEEMIKKMTNA
jgi:O-antigen ligase